MYSRKFDFAVFDTEQEIADYINKEKVDAISIVHNGSNKYAVFFYRKVMYYEDYVRPSRANAYGYEHGFDGWD